MVEILEILTLNFKEFQPNLYKTRTEGIKNKLQGPLRTVFKTLKSNSSLSVPKFKDIQVLYKARLKDF